MHERKMVMFERSDYWQPFFDLLDGAVAAGFMNEPNSRLIVRIADPADLLDALGTYDRPDVTKWMAQNQL